MVESTTTRSLIVDVYDDNSGITKLQKKLWQSLESPRHTVPSKEVRRTVVDCLYETITEALDSEILIDLFSAS